MESSLISSLITTDFEVVEASKELQSVKSLLMEKGYLVVIKQGAFKGILYPDSLIEPISPIIFDCLKRIPFLKETDNITTAIRAMEKDKCSVFPVTDGQNEFIGIIQQESILQCFSEMLSQRAGNQEFFLNEKRKEIALLNIWNESTNTNDLINNILEHLWTTSGSDAIAIRLESENDFPYYESRGYRDSFLQSDRSLVPERLGVEKQQNSNPPVLECLCGKVLSGNCPRSNDFFTTHGSFWCNDLRAYLCTSSHTGCESNYRKSCLNEGFNSTALIPLKIGKHVLGLLQFSFTSHTALTLERVNMIEDFSQDIALAIANKKNEEMLRYQNERYFGIFETVPHLIVFIDSGGVLIDCNSRIESLLGYPKENIIGKNINTLLHLESREKAFKGLLKAMRGETVSIEEFQMVKQDGTIIDVRVNSSLFPLDKNSSSLRIVSVIEDITDYKKQQKERDNMQNQIFISAKLASIGELAAGVAHEINNPLAILQGNLEDMVDELGERGIKDEWLQITTEKQKKAIRRISKIVRGLRIYSHANTEVKKVFDIHNAIEDTILMVDPIYRKKGVTIIKKLHCPNPKIEANVGKFHQVMMNFFSNAYDAMADKKPKIIVIATEKQGNNARITVSDTGTGISPEIKERIFDTFFTTKPTGKGTGLGLSISHALIKQMNGDILVDSTPGKGTSFSFTLPLSNKMEIQRNWNLESVEFEQKMGRALVVDDEYHICTWLVGFFTDIGMSVDTAENGKEALEKLQTGPYDYLLVDLDMPVMTGFELLQEGHKQKLLEKTKTIIMTGGFLSYSSDDEKDFIETNSFEFLQKPFSKKMIYKMLSC